MKYLRITVVFILIFCLAACSTITNQSDPSIEADQSDPSIESNSPDCGGEVSYPSFYTREAYMSFISENKELIPEDFVYDSMLPNLGDLYFMVFLGSLDEMKFDQRKYDSYLYSFKHTDGSSTSHLYVNHEDISTERMPELITPDNMSNMTYYSALENAHGQITINGVVYGYHQSKIMHIEWVLDGVRFTLTGDLDKFQEDNAFIASLLNKDTMSDAIYEFTNGIKTEIQ